MQYGLSEKQLTEIQSIFSDYPEIDKVILFGSRAIGTYKEASDIDLAIVGKSLPFGFSAKLKSHFEEDTYLPFFFDIIDYASITSEALRQHIDQKGVVIYPIRKKEYKKNTELGKLSVNWSIFTVEKLIQKGVIDKPLDGNHGESHPTYLDFVDSEIPFIMATDIKDGKIDLQNCKYITKNHAAALNKGFAYVGDVLLTHKASLGRTAIVKNIHSDYIMLTPQVTYYRIKNYQVLNNIYLKYFFDSPVFQKNLINHGDSGSTRAYVGITAQRKLPILVPPILEQKAIAEVLSSIDDKIDLLYRQNKTLENMAQTLFKNWFIVERRNNWIKKPLSHIANFLNGLSCQKYPPLNEESSLPVLKIKQLRNGLSDGCDWCDQNVNPKYIVNMGDIIFSWSASLMVKIWNGNTCVLNQHLFKVSSNIYPKWFYYFWCKYHLDKFISISSSHATTMGHIKRSDLDNAMCLLPLDNEIILMSKKMTPLIEKIENNHKQIKKLETIRDTLLPKLISGQIRIA